MDGAGVCGKPHNSLLHGSTNRYCNSARQIANLNQGRPRLQGRGEHGAPSSADLREADAKHSLFQYQDIPFQNAFVDRVTTFFDSGSNVNLVTEDFARRARLKGQPVLQSLVTTGANVSDWTSKAYYVPLVDKWGDEHKVLAYSMKTITSPIEEVNLQPALREFPELGDEYWKIKRPTGNVGLLIGTNDVRLHPHLANPSKHLKGNLRLMTSMFGTGFLIDGSHPDVEVGPHRDYPGGTRDEYEFKKPRGFKRRARTSHHSSVTSSRGQEHRELDVQSKGRPSGGGFLSNVSARGEVGVVGGVSRVPPSWDSLLPPTTTCKLGSKGPRVSSSRY